MDRLGEESGARPSSIRQVALAGFVGTTMEWCAGLEAISSGPSTICPSESNRSLYPS
jgi:hypothetical protein